MHWDVNTGRESAIDLTFVSDLLREKNNWQVLRNCKIGSDHFPTSSIVNDELRNVKEGNTGK